MKFLRYLSWAFRALLFLLLFLFAVRNTEVVTVKFYFDQSWQVPLVLALLAFFALGAALGVLACLSTLFRQRRELLAARRELRAAAREERQAGAPAPAGGR